MDRIGTSSQHLASFKDTNEVVVNTEEIETWSKVGNTNVDDAVEGCILEGMDNIECFVEGQHLRDVVSYYHSQLTSQTEQFRFT